MEGCPIVKSIFCEGLEILDRLWRDLRPELNHHLTSGGFDHGNFRCLGFGFGFRLIRSPSHRAEKSDRCRAEERRDELVHVREQLHGRLVLSRGEMEQSRGTHSARHMTQSCMWDRLEE